MVNDAPLSIQAFFWVTIRVSILKRPGANQDGLIFSNILEEIWETVCWGYWTVGWIFEKNIHIYVTNILFFWALLPSPENFEFI